jgi:hypothetical protein
LYKNRYIKPPVKANVEATLKEIFIPVYFNITPAKTNAVKSLQAKYKEFSNMLPGKYFK